MNKDSNDYVTYIPNAIGDDHVVDVGNVLLSDTTHESKDGFPMEVMYHPTLNFYLVAIQTY